MPLLYLCVSVMYALLLTLASLIGIILSTQYSFTMARLQLGVRACLGTKVTPMISLQLFEFTDDYFSIYLLCNVIFSDLFSSSVCGPTGGQYRSPRSESPGL